MTRTKRLGFTLVELLVAIAILGILAAITFPVFRAAVDAAKRTVCINNYSQIGKALLLYQGDYDDRVPPVNYKDVDFSNPGDDRTWVQTLLPYAGDFRLFRCPADTGREREVPISSGPPGSVWQDYYRASLRSNLGYNYLYFSPLVRLMNGEWHAFPIASSEIANKGTTIVFIDSLWDRSSSGVPYGGGSWVVVPPCRYKEGGVGGRTDTFHLPEGTQYFFGFNPEGWQPQSTQSALVYGGAWPWHRKRFNLLYADGRAATVQLADLTKGCNVDRDWLGLIRSPADYPWDLDE